MEANQDFGGSSVTFVCGNQGKIQEVNSILTDVGIKIDYQKVDLPEIQGDMNCICATKCKAAAEVVEGPVVVEDTSLCFNALQGLPGPYIKWFYEKLGSQGLYKLLAGYEDKSASAICIFGFSEGPGNDVLLCHGETKGTIVEPVGDQGFGWDSCFLPDGMTKTYAQLTFDEKNEVSHRRKALNMLKMHFKKRQAELSLCKNL